MNIEILKIFVGLIVAAVGGMWTYYTWEANNQRRSDEAIAAISDVIVSTHTTCRSNDGALNNLYSSNDDGNDSKLNKRQRACAAGFVLLRQKAFSGPIKIDKPFLVDAVKWGTVWTTLQLTVETAGTNNYQRNLIDESWKAILRLKSGEGG
jgi:hypothetical protein